MPETFFIRCALYKRKQNSPKCPKNQTASIEPPLKVFFKYKVVKSKWLLSTYDTDVIFYRMLLTRVIKNDYISCIMLHYICREIIIKFLIV